MKKILKYLGIVILAAVVVFLSMIVYFKVIRAYDFKLQEKRLTELTDSIQENTDEQDVVQFSLEEDLYLNEIQLIATHNSYKKMPNNLGMFFVSLYDKEEDDRLRYKHLPITIQFDRGVRGIELDVRKRGKKLVLNHIPLVDNRATSPDFHLALEEIKLWSDNNPDHIPLMIMLEMKGDWEMLDPWLKSIDKEILGEIDEAIFSVFPKDQLILPDDVRVEGKSLKESILQDGWPKLKDTQGKVMFIMLPNKKFRDMYHDENENLEGRAIFTSAKNADSNTGVIFIDMPDVQKISELVEKNYIVRTRADAHMLLDNMRTQNAMDSGAQILSTDFPAGEPDKDTEYVFTFDGKTVRFNPVLK